MTVLDRRPGESVRDHAERMLVEPLLEGATAVEIAQRVGCAPVVIHDLRRERLAVGVATAAGDEITRLARATAKGIGWTAADGGLGALLRHALVVLELSACDDGTCRHAACEAKRARASVSPVEARSASGATHAAPKAHAGRHEAPRRQQATTGAQPVDQSRGAPGLRIPGGA